MPDHSSFVLARHTRRLALLTLPTVLIVLLGSAVLPWDRMFGDFLCYWTAGKAVASGHSPYDAEYQARTQRQYGWDRDATGLGIYDFLPYYYPPWFGLVWALGVPLGYQATRFAWFFVNVELTILTGYLVQQAVPGVPRRIPLVLVPVFLFSVICVLSGQTSVLIFFLVALAWRLLQEGRDRSAGVVLAWLTIKPQLTAVLLLGILLWLLRQRRPGAVFSFLITLALLCLVSTLVVPSWLPEMLQAPRQTPAPTAYYPWIGNSWFLVLRTLGLRGGWLWLSYLAVALPFLGAVVRMALDRTSALSSLVAVGILAAFFVAPYARHYDFPFLLIPVALLLGNRLSQPAGAALVAALVIVPYLQLLFLVCLKNLHDPSFKFVSESTFFWIPVLLTALWYASGRASRGEKPAPSP